MDSVEHESSSDQGVKEIEECSLSDFKMEIDNDETVEEKPVINLTGTDGENKCFYNTIKEEIKTSEEREYKCHVKSETIDDIEHEDREHQNIIKSEELIIKHLEDDSVDSDYIDMDEPSDFDICSECTVIVAVNDEPVLLGTADRAAQTVPKGTLELRSSDVCSLGVYTRRHLKEGVQLGPYEGHTTKVESTGGCSWKLSEGRLVDTSDETSSNYLRYIKYAKVASERNLMAFQCDGELYYRTCRDIEKGEELLIHFNDNPDEFYKPHEENCEEEFYICQFCQLGLKFEEHRNRHQMFCKIRTDQLHVGSLCKHFAVSNVHNGDDGRSRIEPVESIYNSFSYAKNKDSDLNRDTSVSQKPKNVFRCTDCSFETYHKSCLNTHKLKHAQNNLFKCAVCDYETYCKKNLNKHKLRHLKIKFTCADCDYETCHKVNMDKHKLKHDQNSILKCGYCNYETCYKIAMNRHKSKHDQKNTFKCTYCDYETYDKANLNSHKLRHDRRNTFKCADCIYQTYCERNLNKHKLRHVQKNAFKCAECDYETYYKSNLTKHKLTHVQKKCKL